MDTIGYCAFRECVNLEHINIPSTLKVIDSFAFQYDSALNVDFILPEGFSFMGVTVFGDCVSLPTVSLPGTMTEIPGEVFWGCASLANVTIGEGITAIGEEAFANCTSLHKLTLPSTLESIGDAVFDGITQLDTLVLKSSVPPTVGNGVFANYNTLLIVPCGSLNAYHSHPVWGLFGNVVEDCGSGIDEHDAQDINNTYISRNVPSGLTIP